MKARTTATGLRSAWATPGAVRPGPGRAAPEDPGDEVYGRLSPSLRALALRGQPRRVRRGTRIIVEGETGDTLYIVLQGQLRAYGAGPDGREITYGTYGAGEYVGELGLDGGPRSANVEAVSASVVVLVTRGTLMDHLQQHPDFALELLAKVIWRCRTVTASLKQIALNDVYGRLKLLLERLVQDDGSGRRIADPAPSHLEISRELGCSREMVSRLMKDLERGDYVEVGRRRIVLHRALPAKW